MFLHIFHPWVVGGTWARTIFEQKHMYQSHPTANWKTFVPNWNWGSPSSSSLMRDEQSFWKFLWARLGSSRQDGENDLGGNHQNWTLYYPQIIPAHKSESRRKYEKVFSLYWMNRRDCEEWQTFCQTLAQGPLKSVAKQYCFIDDFGIIISLPNL